MVYKYLPRTSILSLRDFKLLIIFKHACYSSRWTWLVCLGGISLNKTKSHRHNYCSIFRKCEQRKVQNDWNQNINAVTLGCSLQKVNNIFSFSEVMKFFNGRFSVAKMVFNNSPFERGRIIAQIICAGNSRRGYSHKRRICVSFVIKRK